jgi:hypothetical protein
MSRKRASLDTAGNTGDAQFAELFDRKFVPELTLRQVAFVIFALWGVAFLGSAALNTYKGYSHSAQHIQDQLDYYLGCLASESHRARHWQACHDAKIDKDLSLAMTTASYVLEHTHVCILVSCWSVGMDFVDRVGWVVVAMSMGAIALFLLFGRSTTTAPPNMNYDTPMLYSSYDGVGSRTPGHWSSIPPPRTENPHLIELKDR